ncbi:MAG TPA: multiheme c-type cytochrome, partial [Steroidobacteraceae bacterium]|nr:multiheme c-type cytochrome [Steroidobacteraceae bacterium]
MNRAIWKSVISVALFMALACIALVAIALFLASQPAGAATLAAAADKGAARTAGPMQLPYQATTRHLGVATCSSSVCHGSVKANGSYDVQLNEYITWSHDDTHSKAYTVLLNDRSRAIAAKLGLPNAHTAKMCLDCHADNVPESQRGREFNLSDGVGCEACHGGAERWLDSHTSKKATYEANVKLGMFATANVAPRASLCLSCHLGNA